MTLKWEAAIFQVLILQRMAIMILMLTLTNWVALTSLIKKQHLRISFHYRGPLYQKANSSLNILRQVILMMILNCFDHLGSCNDLF